MWPLPWWTTQPLLCPPPQPVTGLGNQSSSNPWLVGSSLTKTRGHGGKIVANSWGPSPQASPGPIQSSQQPPEIIPHSWFMTEARKAQAASQGHRPPGWRVVPICEFLTEPSRAFTALASLIPQNSPRSAPLCCYKMMRKRS